MNPFVLFSSFLLGALGSLHCLGMCGPLALSMPFFVQPQKKWRNILSFYLAKALAYSLLGGIMGLAGKVIMLMKWQQIMSVTTGIFILIMAMLPALRHVKASFLFQKQFQAVHVHILQQPKWRYFFTLGFLNGLLPCGMVYTALATAMLAGGIAGGSTAMLLFGIGTAPMLILLIFFRQRLNVKWRLRLLPLSSAFSIIIGLLLIIRGLNLGLPLISPHVTNQEISKCCHK